MSDMFEYLEELWNSCTGEFTPLGSWTEPHSVETMTYVDFSTIGHWIVLFAVLLALCVSIMARGRLSWLFNWLSKHLFESAFVVWILGVVLYIIGFYNVGINGVSVVLRAIISSFKMFVASNDLVCVVPFLQLDTLYSTAFAIIHFLAAYISFMFIFMMVGYRIKSSLNIIYHKFFKSQGKVVHLFWGVNEASCLLAESIRKTNPSETIIFVDIDENGGDNSGKTMSLGSIANTITITDEEMHQLNSLDALVDHCFNGPTAISNAKNDDIFGALRLTNIGAIVEKSHRIYFYFLSNNEANNISGALNLKTDYRLQTKEKETSVIFIHARKNAHNDVLDHYSQYVGSDAHVKIKIVDSSYLSVAMLKCDEMALPVNCVDVDCTTGIVKSPFTAMIVGLGDTGQEAFKFLYEFSAFVGKDGLRTPFKCYAIDNKMEKIMGAVRSKQPAITDEELVFINTSIDSDEYWQHIKSIIDNLNYVVVTVCDDSLGLSCAVNIFKYALAHRRADGTKLKIMVRCLNHSNEKRMSEVVENLNNSAAGSNIELRLFGLERSIYSIDIVLSDTIMHRAMTFNAAYAKSMLVPEAQWHIDFGERELAGIMQRKGVSRYHAICDVNRRIEQNISNALHMHTKMKLMGLDGDDRAERLMEYCGYVDSRRDMTAKYICEDDICRKLNNIAMVEHERWVASHKLMGYTYAEESDIVAKHHLCLCPWSELTEEYKSYDCSVVDATIRLMCKDVNKM